MIPEDLSLVPYYVYAYIWLMHVLIPYFKIIMKFGKLSSIRDIIIHPQVTQQLDYLIRHWKQENKSIFNVGPYS